MIRVLLIIVGILTILLVISVCLNILTFNNIEKWKTKYSLLEQDKNLSKQTVDKYIRELEEKERINKQLNNSISKIKGVKNEEIINNYYDLWNDGNLQNNPANADNN